MISIWRKNTLYNKELKKINDKIFSSTMKYVKCGDENLQLLSQLNDITNKSISQKYNKYLNKKTKRLFIEIILYISLISLDFVLIYQLLSILILGESFAFGINICKYYLKFKKEQKTINNLNNKYIEQKRIFDNELKKINSLENQRKILVEKKKTETKRQYLIRLRDDIINYKNNKEIKLTKKRTN